MKWTMECSQWSSTKWMKTIVKRFQLMRQKRLYVIWLGNWIDFIVVVSIFECICKVYLTVSIVSLIDDMDAERERDTYRLLIFYQRHGNRDRRHTHKKKRLQDGQKRRKTPRTTFDFLLRAALCGWLITAPQFIIWTPLSRLWHGHHASVSLLSMMMAD